MRGQVEEKIASEIQENNLKQINQLKRKLEMQVDERSQELQARLQRDFEIEVRKRSDEIALKREKEAMQKYKSLYSREQKELEIKLQKDFQGSVKAVREELDSERAEVARLKSLEQIRLRKLGEQKKDLFAKIKSEKLELDKQKQRMEQQARSKKLKEWEQMEQRKVKESSFMKVKVLHDDMGCEQVSRSYHIANKQKSPEREERDNFKDQEFQNPPKVDQKERNRSREFVVAVP